MVNQSSAKNPIAENADLREIKHPFGPLYSRESRVLILGSFPSVKSREQNFFYGHPQNRFWKVISNIFDKPVPVTIYSRERILASSTLRELFVRASIMAGCCIIER